MHVTLLFRKALVVPAIPPLMNHRFNRLGAVNYKDSKPADAESRQLRPQQEQETGSDHKIWARALSFL